MSNHNNRPRANGIFNETNAADEATAQAATAVLESAPAKPKAAPVNSDAFINTEINPTDMQFFLDNMRVSDTDAVGAEPYSWKRSEDAQFWRIIWVPLARYMSLKDALLSRAIILVEKSGSILGKPFSGENGLFKDASFDEATGRVHSKFVSKNEQLGTYEPEMVLCLQPIAAHQAMNQRMVKRVIEKTERKPEERSAEERAEMYKVARDQGARKGAVQISNYEGWDNP